MSDRIIFGGVSGGSRQYAQNVLDRYPVGTDVAVFYDPNTPSTAALKAGYKNNALAKCAGGVLFCALGAFVYRTWKRKKLPR